MLINLDGVTMVAGRDCKRKFERGITLLEALVSTAIIAIGFIAIFQMVQYSIRSIDVSGERTKSNMLISMVAEDLISEKNATSPTKKVPFVDYLIEQEKAGNPSWNAPSCVSGSSTNQTFKNTVDAKKYKWANRFSKRRLKCKGTENKKELKLYAICNTKSGNSCKYENKKNYNGTGIYDQLVIGRMEVNISTGRLDEKGKKPKPKKNVLYFQVK